MAARLKPRHQEEIKSKIQSSKLVDFLQAVALTDNHPNVTALKIDSAKFLLNKSISNAPTEIDQNILGDISIETSQRPQLTKEEWLIAHGLGTSTGHTE